MQQYRPVLSDASFVAVVPRPPLVFSSFSSVIVECDQPLSGLSPSLFARRGRFSLRGSLAFRPPLDRNGSPISASISSSSSSPSSSRLTELSRPPRSPIFEKNKFLHFRRLLVHHFNSREPNDNS